MSVTEAVRNPRSYLDSKWRMYRSLLFDPEAFYDDHLDSNGLLREVLVVTVVGLLGTIGGYYAVTTLIEPFSANGALGGLPNDVKMQLWRNAVEPLVVAYLLWFGLTGALYGISWLYTAVGSAYALLKNTAWALVPLAFANLLRSAALIATAYGVDVETDLPTGLAERQADYLWSQVGGEPLVVAAAGLGIVFVLWSGYIGAYAVADVRDLSADEAYRVAAVPTLAYAAYVGYQAVVAL